MLFCGINPGLGSAANGHHFSNPSNRFWRAIHLAGFTPQQLRPDQDRDLLDYGCGLTTVVARPTVRAAQLSRQEFLDAATTFEQKIRRWSPRHLAFPGKSAWSTISRQDKLGWGMQPDPWAGARIWVLPNPSGLNRAFDLAALVEAYSTLRRATDRAGRT